MVLSFPIVSCHHYPFLIWISWTWIIVASFIDCIKICSVAQQSAARKKNVADEQHDKIKYFGRSESMDRCTSICIQIDEKRSIFHTRIIFGEKLTNICLHMFHYTGVSVKFEAPDK